MRCWYTRWQMSNALDDGDLASRLAHGHAARCASCQSFGRSLGALHADLARTAHTATRPLPVVHRARRPLLVAGTLALGGAAALIVALGVGIGSGTTETPAQIPSETPVAITDPLARVRSVADRFSQALVKTPLETELEALIQDGKRGLDAVLATGGIRGIP
jgi:hypothetical protein